jgi:hypothetical protein
VKEKTQIGPGLTKAIARGNRKKKNGGQHLPAVLD